MENAFPSDSLQVALDRGTDLPRDLAECTQPSMARLSVSINTYYPELHCGKFYNWRVIDAVDEAIRRTELVIVDPEFVDRQAQRIAVSFTNVRAEPTEDMGHFPIERLLGVELGELYVLLTTRQSFAGYLMKWTYGAGGGEPFFCADNLIIDMLTGAMIRRRLVDTILCVCREADIKARVAD